LNFPIEQTEAINALGLPNCEVSPLFSEFSCLLSTLFTLMTQMESSKGPLARACSLIIDGIEELECYAAEAERRGMKEGNGVVVIYKSAVQMIRRFTLDSTYNLLQLSSVLTPDGHKTAKL
jgi:hypothetical protein